MKGLRIRHGLCWKCGINAAFKAEADDAFGNSLLRIFDVPAGCCLSCGSWKKITVPTREPSMFRMSWEGIPLVSPQNISRNIEF